MKKVLVIWDNDMDGVVEGYVFEVEAPEALAIVECHGKYAGSSANTPEDDDRLANLKAKLDGMKSVIDRERFGVDIKPDYIVICGEVEL